MMEVFTAKVGVKPLVEGFGFDGWDGDGRIDDGWHGGELGSDGWRSGIVPKDARSGV